MPDRYGRVVTPIYFGNRDGNLAFEGSAVLVKSAASSWLFTAAHVLAARMGRPTILPGPPGQFIQLTGLPEALREPAPAVPGYDPVDLAYVRLSEKESNALTAGGLSFLPVGLDTIDGSKSSLAGARCVVTGYPDNPGVHDENRGVKIDHEKRVCEVTQLSLSFPLFADETMFRFGYSSAQHLGLRYDRFYANGKKICRPWPKGMSGGAMWLWFGDTPRLAGIFTEFQKNRSLLLGTRLHMMIEAIVHRLRAE